jgi:hypothetical protein
VFTKEVKKQSEIISVNGTAATDLLQCLLTHIEVQQLIIVIIAGSLLVRDILSSRLCKHKLMMAEVMGFSYMYSLDCVTGVKLPR